MISYFLMMVQVTLIQANNQKTQQQARCHGLVYFICFVTLGLEILGPPAGNFQKPPQVNKGAMR
jgi:hypothetical protein